MRGLPVAFSISEGTSRLDSILIQWIVPSTFNGAVRSSLQVFSDPALTLKSKTSPVDRFGLTSIALIGVNRWSPSRTEQIGPSSAGAGASNPVTLTSMRKS